MNIPKAIELIEIDRRTPYILYDLELKEAIRLGKEALKIIRAFRRDSDLDPGQLLPGETEE